MFFYILICSPTFSCRAICLLNIFLRIFCKNRKCIYRIESMLAIWTGRKPNWRSHDLLKGDDFILLNVILYRHDHPLWYRARAILPPVSVHIDLSLIISMILSWFRMTAAHVKDHREASSAILISIPCIMKGISDVIHIISGACPAFNLAQSLNKFFTVSWFGKIHFLFRRKSSPTRTYSFHNRDFCRVYSCFPGYCIQSSFFVSSKVRERIYNFLQILSQPLLRFTVTVIILTYRKDLHQFPLVVQVHYRSLPHRQKDFP